MINGSSESGGNDRIAQGVSALAEEVDETYGNLLRPRLDPSTFRSIQRMAPRKRPRPKVRPRRNRRYSGAIFKYVVFMHCGMKFDVRVYVGILVFSWWHVWVWESQMRSNRGSSPRLA